MAAATDYSGWVRELDSYQQRADDGAADDPRVEAGHRPAALPTARAGKGARPATSQADELQQEMKLLNWHKLANEAALKAAIIKTSKIKKEDAQVASSLTLDEREERAQRVQQIIEEEQLRPLEVNSEFFRDFEAKGQRDEAKLEDDVQRHIQHLRRLKDAMAQKEDAQRRRRQYRERVQELQPPPVSAAWSAAKRAGNQEEDEQQQQQRQQCTTAPNSVYQRIADAQQRGGRANAEVAGSLDKLMELEKRIRHLEDAGLGVDALDGSQDPAEADLNAGVGSSNVRFAKRRSGGGPHEPSRTVYTVKPAASKARAKDALTDTRGGGATKKRPAQPAKKRGLASGVPGSSETFLTSLPESKQRQMRRMTDRERRNFVKAEKAGDARQRALKQDVVIDGWLDKKRQAAAQRKATSSQVRAGGGGAGGKPCSSAAGASSRRLPAPPKVRAPTVGAASGKRISALNPHMQRFDDMKRGFDKRREMLHRPPQPAAAPRAAPARAVDARTRQRGGGTTQRRTPSSSGPQLSVTGGSRLHPGASLAPQPQPQPKPNTRRADARAAASTVTAPQRVGNAQVSLVLPGGGPTAAARPATKLPPILPTNGTSAGALPASNARAVARDAAPRTSSGLGGLALPRIAGARVTALPSPPPGKNPHVPQFSRLHKR